jgi:formamidopyrimidine-DNA glycosylase
VWGFQRLVGYQQHVDANIVRASANKLDYVALGLCGEAGELASKVGKWVRGEPSPSPRFARVGLSLADGATLYFVDARLLGGVVPCPLDEGERAFVEGLGPDALGSPLPALRGARPVKVALMDQAVVAGIGNVQAMEALWRAGIDPRTPCDALDDAAHARLDAALQTTLRTTLAEQGDGDTITYVEESLAANPFRVYRRQGTPCPTCKTDIERMIQAGRSTYWCPSCQPPRG